MNHIMSTLNLVHILWHFTQTHNYTFWLFLNSAGQMYFGILIRFNSKFGSKAKPPLSLTSYVYVGKIKNTTTLTIWLDTQKFSKLNEGQTCDYSFYTCQVPKYSFNLDSAICSFIVHNITQLVGLSPCDAEQGSG